MLVPLVIIFCCLTAYPLERSFLRKVTLLAVMALALATLMT